MAKGGARVARARRGLDVLCSHAFSKPVLDSIMIVVSKLSPFTLLKFNGMLPHSNFALLLTETLYIGMIRYSWYALNRIEAQA